MSEMTKRVDAVGAETSSHIDGDAEITTYTFNEAQMQTFTEMTKEAAQESIKKSILESGLLENKPMTVFSFVLKGEELEQYMRHRGHNQAVEAVKEFISNMDTNSVDSIHLNKQAN